MSMSSTEIQLEFSRPFPSSISHDCFSMSTTPVNATPVYSQSTRFDDDSADFVLISNE